MLLTMDASITSVEDVTKIVVENHGITIRKVAENAAISIGLCHAIFSDVLGVKLTEIKFVLEL